jgi:C-terminal processing protease CtpA/Prc
LTALGDRPPHGPCGLEVAFHFVDDHAIVSAVPEGLSLQVGDILLELDGRSLSDLIDEWRPYYPASNEPARLLDISAKLSFGECGPVDVVIDRDGLELELELERERVLNRGASPYPWRVDGRPGGAFQWIGDDVAYIRLDKIELDEIPNYIEAAAGTRGLVIDIRGYPNEFVVYELGQHLVDAPTPFARCTEPDLSNPGAFTWQGSLELSPKPPHYEGKVVILVNELSISQSEFTAMAFRAAPGSLVIGSTTAGADGNVSRIDLPGGESTQISGIGIFYPDKRPTQRIGIVPDIRVTPTREGIRDGRDEVLERALREILGPEVPAAIVRELARPSPPAGG